MKMISTRQNILNLILILTTFNSRSHAQQFDGNADEIMASLRDVMGTAGEFSGNKKAFMTQSACKFECKNGGKPKKKPNHIPASNGCGSFGIILKDHLDVADLTKCCDQHDFCYDTCNNEKDACDTAFKKCMEKTCKHVKGVVSDDVYKNCKSTADVMHAGTVALGCKAYKDSQKNACICQAKRQVKDGL